MKTPTQKMDVSRPAYIWLSQVRASMIAANGGRGVTWPEVWDHVRAVYEAATAARAASVSVRLPEPGETREAYDAYLDSLFAPIGTEVARLRAEAEAGQQ